MTISKKLILGMLLFQCLSSSNASINTDDSVPSNKSSSKLIARVEFQDLPDSCSSHISSYLLDSGMIDKNYLNFAAVNNKLQRKLKLNSKNFGRKFSTNLKRVYQEFRQRARQTLPLKWFDSVEMFIKNNKIHNNAECLELQYLYCTEISHVWFSPFFSYSQKKKIRAKAIFHQFRRELISSYLEELLPETKQKTENIVSDLFEDTYWSKEQKRTPAQSFFADKITKDNKEKHASFFKFARVLITNNFFDRQQKISERDLWRNSLKSQHRIGKAIIYVLAWRGNLDAQYLLRSLKSHVIQHPNNTIYDVREFIVVNNQNIYFPLEEVANRGYATAQFDMGQDTKDPVVARAWYQKSADQGHLGALEKISALNKKEQAQRNAQISFGSIVKEWYRVIASTL